MRAVSQLRLAAGLVLLVGVVSAARAGDMLDAVTSRGVLHCGVSEGIAGLISSMSAPSAMSTSISRMDSRALAGSIW